MVCRQQPGYTASVDDREAHRCAEVPDIAIIGTAGGVGLAPLRGFDRFNRNLPCGGCKALGCG